MTLIYDKLIYFGGGERVLFQINKTLKPNKLFITSYKKNEIWDNELKNICYPFWGKYFNTRSTFLFTYPIICFLNIFYKIKSEKIFCYSSSYSKYFNLQGKKKILYVNFPARGIVNPEVFIKSKYILFLLKPLIHYFKLFEKKQYDKFDEIYSISKHTQKILYENYNVTSKVLYCPTSSLFYENSKPLINRNNNYILISRLEESKNLKYIFEVFNMCTYELIVIGTGTLLDHYKQTYPKINFKGFLDDQNLIQELSIAQCCIIPTILEYGLPIIESFSRGTPVICVESPASKELITDFEIEYNCKLGIIFKKPDTHSFLKALNTFNNLKYSFDSYKILDIANIFHPNNFDISLKKIMNNNDN